MATGTSLEDLTYVGMVGIIDPERPQVEEAIVQLKAGGVIVKMITGDAEKTAKAIATRLKIYSGNELTLSGEDLDHMNATDLRDMISQASIFYRVSPKHKLTIVKVNSTNENDELLDQGIFSRLCKLKDISSV